MKVFQATTQTDATIRVDNGDGYIYLTIVDECGREKTVILNVAQADYLAHCIFANLLHNYDEAECPF